MHPSTETAANNCENDSYFAASDGEENFQDTLESLNKIVTRNVIERADVDSLIEVFLNALLCGSNFQKGEVRELTKQFCRFDDLFALTLNKLALAVKKIVAENAKWKVYWFLLYSSKPKPNSRKTAKLLSIKPPLNKSELELPNAYQKVWLNFIGLDLTPKMLRSLVPQFVEQIIDRLPKAELFADFLYSVHNRGHYFAVLSLGGIFKLIVNRNFEYPNFYSDVYHLICPSICYSNYAQKFFDLVDIILASTYF